MTDKLEKLKAARAKAKSDVAKAAIDKKIARLEASAPKPKAPKEEAKPKKAPKASGSKGKRHLFEAKLKEGEKFVKVIVADTKKEAEELLKDAANAQPFMYEGKALDASDFDFVKVITRGRSPKEGLVKTSKAKASKPKARAKATREERAEIGAKAGMTKERAAKAAESVKAKKKRGRKPLEKEAFLFEMPLKTQEGKVKRKVITATSKAQAEKQAGKNYTFVRELKEGENPKVGVQPIEGYVKPAPKKRGPKPKGAAKKPSKEVVEKAKAKRRSSGKAKGMPPEIEKMWKKDTDRATRVAENLLAERKAEAIGEGIGIANEQIADQLRDLANGKILEMEDKADILKMEAQNLSNELRKLGEEIFQMVKDIYGKE